MQTHAHDSGNLFTVHAGFSTFSINTSILKCSYYESTILIIDSRLICISPANFTALRHDIFNHLKIPKKDKSKLLENLRKVQI